jgi:hypothetical protein
MSNHPFEPNSCIPIDINGVEWLIVFKPIIPHSNPDKCYGGICFRRARTILITAEQPADQMLETIVHEVLHATLGDNEESISQAAHAVRCVLHILGWRLTEPPTNERTHDGTHVFAAAR